MPELPEVETIRRGLSKIIIGRTISDVQVRQAKLRWPVDAGKLSALATGQPIASVKRRAKYLLLELGNQANLVFHLGMSGRLLVFTKKRPPEKHDHVLFHFSDGAELCFNDPRRFGMVDVILPAELDTYPRFRNLGVEPLDENVDPEQIFGQISASKRSVKTVLMDAAVIAGVGNIYANEALFHAGIHPACAMNQLSLQQWRTLFSCVRDVLQQAVAMGGTTLNDFLDSSGNPGYFQQTLAVYGREDLPCPRCHQPIRRIVQTGRSSFFCSHCQSCP